MNLRIGLKQWIGGGGTETGELRTLTPIDTHPMTFPSDRGGILEYSNPYLRKDWGVEKIVIQKSGAIAFIPANRELFSRRTDPAGINTIDYTLIPIDPRHGSSLVSALRHPKPKSMSPLMREHYHIPIARNRYRGAIIHDRHDHELHIEFD